MDKEKNHQDVIIMITLSIALRLQLKPRTAISIYNALIIESQMLDVNLCKCHSNIIIEKLIARLITNKRN